jgi:asparagine synthase (glutamine-hydrolysing)
VCGIAGIFDLDHGRVDSSAIREFLAPVRHRGPDDEGYAVIDTSGGPARTFGGADTPSAVYSSGLPQNAGIGTALSGAGSLLLGHRRLSIIDVSAAGHQPLCDAGRSVWIAYNGEIYNYRELKAELASLGHAFYSMTDTEVIVEAWKEWGRDCFRRFNGMWAFLLWDARTSTLVMSRDRFGVKPLYWTVRSGVLYCASELKQFRALDACRTGPDEAAISDYLLLGLTDHEDRTFFKDISQLPPGTSAFVRPGADPVFERYYAIPATTPEPFTLARLPEVKAGVRTLLFDSVRLRLRSDVAVGSCLSGGLDSSGLTGLAHRLLVDEHAIDAGLVGDRLKTFTAAFEDPRFDEREFVEQFSAAVPVDSRFVFPDAASGWDELEKLVFVQDQPFISTSIYAQYKVMELGRNSGVKVLLDGQGADETAGGYMSYLGPWLMGLLLKRGPFRFLSGLSQAASSNGVPALKLLWGMKAELARFLPFGLYRQFLGLALGSDRIVRPGVTRLAAGRLRNWYEDRGRADVQARLRADVSRYNIRSLLRYEDRNSMAHSMESRVPYLDYRLVEYLFALGPEWKFRNGWRKYILREALDGVIPDSLRWRKDKKGFVTTEKDWLRACGPGLLGLFTGAPRSADWIDPKPLALRFRRFLADRGDVMGVSRFWRYLNLELWLRRFFG